MSEIQKVYNLATELDDITSQCLKCIMEGDYISLNTFLSQRKQMIEDLRHYSEQISSFLSQNSSIQSQLKQLMKKISKDSQLLVDNISEEKKGVVDQIKLLRRGRSSLTHLKEKIRHKKVVSKLI